jgi:hypothetical protein
MGEALGQWSTLGEAQRAVCHRVEPAGVPIHRCHASGKCTVTLMPCQHLHGTVLRDEDDRLTRPLSIDVVEILDKIFTPGLGGEVGVLEHAHGCCVNEPTTRSRYSRSSRAKDIATSKSNRRSVTWHARRPILRLKPPRSRGPATAPTC